MDSGPLIIQAALGIDAGETAEKLAPAHPCPLSIASHPQALQWLCEGRLERRGRKVFPAPGRKALPSSPEGCLPIWPPLEEGCFRELQIPASRCVAPAQRAGLTHLNP